MADTPTAVVAVVVALFLAACGGASEPTADVVGTLAGDPQLEGGCAWLDVDAGRSTVGAARVEPSWPQGYRVELEPVRLVGPDGQVVAEDGDVVMVDGTLRPDMATICMVGPLFEVTRIHGPD